MFSLSENVIFESFFKNFNENQFFLDKNVQLNFHKIKNIFFILEFINYIYFFLY